MNVEVHPNEAWLFPHRMATVGANLLLQTSRCSWPLTAESLRVWANSAICDSLIAFVLYVNPVKSSLCVPQLLE